ncbi:DUF1007 family protein [Pseudooceanicola sp.]|uniref:DUF1007 family protein n=1 Tax=Pseudooceanicola sp. TaxID=1914328 RepID=UPI0040584C81
MCPGKEAEAHPHIFVDARAGFLFDERGHLNALRIRCHRWVVDRDPQLRHVVALPAMTCRFCVNIVMS